MLPGLEGTEVCRLLKQDPETHSIPVIMVTAKSEESDIVLGLGIGADDYICKPFSPKELVARVKAVLRRGRLKEETVSAHRITRAGLVIDADRHEVLVDDEPVYFTATEFRMLHFLASHPGRAFTRDHLLSRVMGEDVMIYDRNIDVHIKSIRRKLGEHRALVETVRGIGYRFKDDRGSEC
jgi:two-component system phosphate regulon response regulator PhoB